MKAEKQNIEFLRGELAEARWKIQSLEINLEQHKGVRKSVINLFANIKEGLLFHLRRLYHSHFSGHKSRLRKEALLKNPGFTPYRIRYHEHSVVQRRRILHAIPSFTTGGSQQLIIDIIEGTDHLYEHLIITHNDWGITSYTGVPLKELAYVRNKRAVLKVLEAYKPDVVHIHYWGNRTSGYEHWRWYHHVFEAAFSFGCRVIENCNNPIVPYLDARIDLYVFVSEYAKQYFGTPALKSTVIYPGSNFSLFKPFPENSLSKDWIGMVYRLDRDKLNEASIDVFIKVVQCRPQTKVLIVGKGFYESIYRRRVEDAGLSDAFEFSGMVSYEKLPEYYNRISLFVTPVHKESFGQVTPFAMNMGITVAGYDVGALSEILNDDSVLVPAGDTDALANLIISLLDDPDRMQKIGAYNTQRAQALFSLQTMVESYREEYGKLLGL